MNTIYTQYIETPVGDMIMGTYDNQLCLLDFRRDKKRSKIDQRLSKILNATFVSETNHPILSDTRLQLQEYFNNQRTNFTVPLMMIGTDFQKSVWKALLEIPYGKTISYLQLAQAINRPTATRAVANANGANAMAIIIPCHRVINHDGKLGGFGGGLDTKKTLLKLEGVNKKF